MKRYVSWEETEEFVSKVEKIGPFNAVYGIPRGGLVLAVMISHAYGVPILSAPCKGCLIVDDISDSGETLLHYQNNTSGSGKNDYKIATVAYRQGSLVRPDFYLIEKNNQWLIFPWEMGKED